MSPRKKGKPNEKPVSLHPLSPEDALRGLLQVKPEGRGNTMPQFQSGDKVQIAKEARGVPGEYVDAIGTIQDMGGLIATGTVRSDRTPLPPMSEWEQLYIVQLSNGHLVLAQESWLIGV
jgi:hypothetical protein